MEPILSEAMRSPAFLLILTIAASSASAQSLADVARKESERRQAVKDSGKAYTNADLKPVPGAPPADAAAPSPDADSSTPAAGDAPASKDGAASDAAPGADTGAQTTDAREQAKADDEVKDQAYWAKRMARLREQLDRDQTFLSALQSRIDALTTDFVNRDDPAQRSAISAERQKALVELDRLKKAVVTDTQAIPDLEEEARREGVPAGWLR